MQYSNAAVWGKAHETFSPHARLTFVLGPVYSSSRSDRQHFSYFRCRGVGANRKGLFEGNCESHAWSEIRGSDRQAIQHIFRHRGPSNLLYSSMYLCKHDGLVAHKNKTINTGTTGNIEIVYSYV